MSAEYSVEEVRACLAEFSADVAFPREEIDIDKVRTLLTAYADMIERAQAGVTREVLDRASDKYLTARHNQASHDDGMRSALLAVWPVARADSLEMRICEISHVILKPNINYIFTVDPNCEGCRQAVQFGAPPAQTVQVDEDTADELDRQERLRSAQSILDGPDFGVTNRNSVAQGDAIDRNAYEGAREDLLDWKGRAQRAEAKLRSLGYSGIDASEVHHG